MKNINIKKIGVIALITVNIFVAGAVFGAIQGYHYAKDEQHATEAAVHNAIQTIPVTQASATSPK